MDSPATIAEIAGNQRPGPDASRRSALRMRSLRDIVNIVRSPATGSAQAMAALFPELHGERLIEGVLRAPWRGRQKPPLLSARPSETACADLPTPGRVLADRGWEEPALLARATAARRALVMARAGGEWWHPEIALPAGGQYAVAALAEPMAAPSDDAMGAILRQALAEGPAERLVVIAPPTRGSRLKPMLEAAARRGAAIVGPLVDPWGLLDRADRVYSAGGETGFLALLAGLPVTAFAGSFYTGWGVTADADGVAQHPFPRSVDAIFAGACLLATRYRDPFRDCPANFEAVLPIVADWRRLEAENRGIAVCVGMSFWKRRRIADFVRSSAGTPVFRRSVAGALAICRASEPPGAIAGWASRLPEGLAAAAADHGVPLIRVEDGFIRSVGLGSDFLPPASLVFDKSGMYYDPRSGSDLEIILRDSLFDPALVARAEILMARLVARGVTKYNLAKYNLEGGGPRLDLPQGRRRILVPGQVEDDLSIRFGAGTIRSNLALLAEVRAANPDAFILYKPHPDVVAGHRVGAVPEAEALQFADLVIEGGATAALLAEIDELHTMTSLAGFEALLRGRHVVVYGRPFYAGWGLTIDLPPFERGRRLSLAELVAGALILYPRYLDPLTHLPCGPEIIIERLDHPELWRPGLLVLARRLQGLLARRLGEARTVLPSAGSSPARGLRERPRP